MNNRELDENLRIYKPDVSANECCVICKKNIDGCSWSRKLEPVEGWQAIETDRVTYGVHGSYKILYCPEFEEGDSSKGRDFDRDACNNLIEAVYRNAAADYRNAYKRKLKAERHPLPDKREIEFAEQRMFECSFLLGKWTDQLKEMVEKEMGEGGADAKE